MLTAAKVLALTGSRFIKEPDLLNACRDAFLEDTRGFEYQSPIIPGDPRRPSEKREQRRITSKIKKSG
jgi:hypothetical protein